MTRLHSILAAAALATQGCDAPAPDEPGVFAGMGIMAGEVTPRRALVQVRLTATDRFDDGDLPGAPGVVEFILEKAEEEAEHDAAAPAAQLVEAAGEHDFIARAVFENLDPGTRYRCRTRIGATREDLRDGPAAQFKTLPGPESADPVRFVVVTGMNYAKFHGDDRIDRAQHLVENNTELPAPYAGPDKHLGYPALASILALEPKPDFFVGTGDNVYYDTPDNPRAETVPELRRKWHEQFGQPRYRDLFARVPTYWMIDDHDYRIDDGDNSGDYEPTPETGRRMMLEQLPVAAREGEEDAKTYRTHRVNRDLQIWFPENRMHRSENATPDGPEKTIWGAAQKAWLMRTLQESDATFKLLISPTPMIGPDDVRKTDNHTNHGGFRHERDAFFAWLGETGLDRENFFIVCGDRHWQYHSIHPTGIEEFSCGALVDANSRLGRKPGDPASTDPDGLIRQPYSQERRSGGFLSIDVVPAVAATPPKLTFTWHDEHGTVLHSTVKHQAMDTIESARQVLDQQDQLAIWYTEYDGRTETIRYANETFAQTFGHSVDEVLAKKRYHLVNPPDTPADVVERYKDEDLEAIERGRFLVRSPFQDGKDIVVVKLRFDRGMLGLFKIVDAKPAGAELALQDLDTEFLDVLRRVRPDLLD